jgi:hypothetical protein
MEFSTCLEKMNALVKKNIYGGESEANDLRIRAIGEDLASFWTAKKHSGELFYRNAVHAPIAPNEPPPEIKTMQQCDRLMQKRCRQWHKFFWSDVNGCDTPLVVRHASVSKVCTWFLLLGDVFCVGTETVQTNTTGSRPE